MSSHQYTRRLQRLLTLVNEIKTNPYQSPEALYTALGVSSAMFYKDRQMLAELGFAFRYDRRQRQQVITQDQFLPVLNLSTSEVLALIMSVRQLSSSGDYTLTYDAIAALRKVISTTPAALRASSRHLWTTSSCRKALAATPRCCRSSGTLFRNANGCGLCTTVAAVHRYG